MTDTPAPPTTPAGWHPDPHNGSQMRYWDGAQWTSHTAPVAPAAATVQTETAPRRKKRRVFWWFFLAIQILFVVWIIAGAASSGDTSHCGSLDAKTCQDAQDAGTAIGVALIVVFWLIVDLLLAVIYTIYRLTRRSA